MAPDQAEPAEDEPRSKRKELEEAKEEVEFQLPEFDEADYIRSEIRDARLALVTLGFAAVWAGLTRLLQIVTGNLFLAFITVFVGAWGLKKVLARSGADIEDLDKKKWLGIGAVFFFSWLGFWTLYLNPPFT